MSQLSKTSYGLAMALRHYLSYKLCVCTCARMCVCLCVCPFSLRSNDSKDITPHLILAKTLRLHCQTSTSAWAPVPPFKLPATILPEVRLSDKI